jgi:hypothetical protein
MNLGELNIPQTTQANLRKILSRRPTSYAFNPGIDNRSSIRQRYNPHFEELCVGDDVIKKFAGVLVQV